MNNSGYFGAPGPGATTSQSFKEILASTDLQAKLPGGVLLVIGHGVVVKGTVLGKITSGGKFGPYAVTTVATGGSSGDTTVIVTDASLFIVGDSVKIGTESAKTITAINYGTNTITVSALTATQAAGVAVAIQDGRQTAVCILDNDADTTNNDVSASAFIAGVFDSTQIIGADAAAKTALKLCYFA